MLNILLTPVTIVQPNLINQLDLCVMLGLVGIFCCNISLLSLVSCQTNCLQMLRNLAPLACRVQTRACSVPTIREADAKRKPIGEVLGTAQPKVNKFEMNKAFNTDR